MSNPMPIQPRPRRDEAQRIADQGRHDIARLQAEAAIAAAQAREVQAFFDGVGQISDTLYDIHLQAAKREALTQHTTAKNALSMTSMKLIRDLSNDNTPGAEVLSRGLGVFRMQRDRAAQGIAFLPQREAFLVETDAQMMALGSRLIEIEDHKTRQEGQTAHFAAIDTHIQQGNPAGARMQWESAVDAKLFNADALRPGGRMETSIKAAAINSITGTAQTIFENEGLASALDWLMNPRSHEKGWLLTGQDLRRARDVLLGMEEGNQLRIGMERDQQRGQVADYLRPMQLGQQPVPTSLAELESNIDKLTSSLLPKERAEIKLQAAKELGFGLADQSDAMKAYTNQVVEDLRREGRELTTAQIPAWQSLISEHAGVGTFGTGAEGRRLRDDLMSYADEQKKELMAPGYDLIDTTFERYRLFMAAMERGVDEPEVLGEQVFDGKKVLQIGDTEGNQVDVVDRDGRPDRRLLSDMKAEVRQAYRSKIEQMLTDKEAVDATAAGKIARQMLAQHITGMLPGAQPGEELIGGVPVPTDYQVREPELKHRWWRPNRPKVLQASPEFSAAQAALEYLGPAGLMREQLTLPKPQPLGDAWAGGLVMRSDELQVSGVVDPSGPAMEAWQGYMADGEFTLAAMVAANELPRDPARLNELMRGGEIFAWEDMGGGHYRVKFAGAGLWHPVFALQEQPSADTEDPNPQGAAVDRELESLDRKRADLTRQMRELRKEWDAEENQEEYRSLASRLAEVGADIGAYVTLLWKRRAAEVEQSQRQHDQDVQLNLDVFYNLTAEY